jgi:hypothetical protein
LLFAIKSIHTFVFLFMSACILYILYAGLAQVYDWKLTVALVLVVLECAVWWFSGRRCPLTSLARQYGDDSGNDWIADIFLPRWAAEKIPPVCGGLFALGLIVLLINLLLSR